MDASAAAKGGARIYLAGRRSSDFGLLVACARRGKNPLSYRHLSGLFCDRTGGIGVR
jgi:hypothetical protein